MPVAAAVTGTLRVQSELIANAPPDSATALPPTAAVKVPPQVLVVAPAATFTPAGKVSVKVP